MKKIYISICAITISVSSIAQIATQNMNIVNPSKEYHQTELIDINEVLSPNSMNASSVTNIIWESDFSNPSVWTNSAGQNPPWHGWSIDATSDGWWSTNGINSTSGGNFAELCNGDAQSGTQLGDVVYTMTTAQPINIFDSIGSGNATLSFEEFGARFYDLQEVQVSMDGITFVTVGDNMSYSQLTASGGSQYANPTLRQINLAPYLGSTPTAVWIRFSWTSALNLAFTDPNYYNTWITYGWYIDDVKVAESPANRVTIEDEVIGGWWIDYANYSGSGLNYINGLDYSLTPLSQIQNHPYAIEAVFKNEGTSAQTVNLTYDVTGVANSSGTSNLAVLNPGDTMFLGASFSPTVTGSYSIDIWGVADSAGAGITTTLTDVKTREIEVTDYIYGKDLGTMEGSRILGGSNDQNHILTRYEMYADESLIALRAFISDESVVGATVKAILYELDTTATSGRVFLAESDDYYLTAQDLGAWVDIPFADPIDLYNGYAYQFGISGYISTVDSSFLGFSGGSLYNGEHSLWDEFGLNPNDPINLGNPTWYYMTSTPMVRMNFDASSGTPQSFDCIGVSCIDPGTGNGAFSSFSACQAACGANGLDEIQSNISIYPNPSNGVFIVELDAYVKYEITINNVLGQTVLITDTDGMNTTIDLSKFNKGLYTIKLRNTHKTYIEKVIVE